MAAALAAIFNFGVLLPVVPLLATGSSEGIGGLFNGTLLATAVAAQWVSPALLHRMDKRHLCIIGLALLSLPCAAYILTPLPAAAIFATAAFRGVGFGLSSVLVAALLLDLAPPGRQGATLGALGVVNAFGGIVAPPLGLELLRTIGPVAPASIALLSGVCALALMFRLHTIHDAPRLTGDSADASGGMVRALSDPAIRAYALAFTLISVPWGGTTTYLAIALPTHGLASAALFLLVSGIFKTIGRGLGGWWCDRGGSPLRLSVWVLNISAAGLALLALAITPLVVMISAVLYGLGSGILQSSMLMAISQRNKYGHGATSAIWGSSLDIGGALGSSALAGVIVLGGPTAVLWTMPAVMITALPLLLRELARKPTVNQHSANSDIEVVACTASNLGMG